MMVLRSPYTFIVVFPVLASAIAFLHIVYPKLYIKSFMYRHTLVSVIVKRFATRGKKRRFISLAIKIAIATLLSLALAQPYIVTQQQVYIESKELSELVFSARSPIVIVLDTSGSMYGEKIETAKRVITDFVKRLFPSIDIGFIEFADRVKQAIAPTSKREEVVEAIVRAEANGGTMYSYPLKTVLNWLKPYRELNISTSIVFVSDGLPGDLPEYREVLKDFKSLGIPIYTIFIGYENEGIAEMRHIADSTDGESFVAETVDKLAEVLNKALEKAVQAIQRVEVSTKITKTVEVYTPLTNIFLLAIAVLYLLYRFIAYRFSGVTF
ncbi:MAG: VWA domain-containing protein [Thaumarchaeota archaeon]|jgi:Ca-activated chloride channel family protein|nr:VWA domain-containing protein [Candidatus Geocrenenecus arthurdayi]